MFDEEMIVAPPPQIAELLETPNSELVMDMPDPADMDTPDHEFLAQLENLWLLCDRFDLQTDIWRGRLLRAIRDREKARGDARGAGFLAWLKNHEISKGQAYNLIELANSADTLLAEGKVEPKNINNFSKNAFIEAANAAPAVQQLLGEAAQDGERITRREVKQLSDEYVTMSSELLPTEIKEKAANGTIPTRFLAPLVQELDKLPEVHQVAIRQEAAEQPDVDNIKTLTNSARNLAKYLDAAAQVQTLRHAKIDIEMALEEALRLDCLSTTAEVVKQATQLEQSATKLYTTWRRLRGLCDRLYVDTGSSNPHLRSILGALSALSGEIVQVPLDEAGEKQARFKVLEPEV